MNIRLVKVAKQLNVGTSTVVEFLQSKGFSVANKPTEKISEEMYEELLQEFGASMETKVKADQLIIDKKIPEWQKRINQEKEEKTGILNLGNCGLTEIPEEVFEMTWLEELVISNRYLKENNIWRRFFNSAEKNKNKVSFIPKRLQSLTKLKILILCGDEVDSWSISKIENLDFASKLTSLELSYNKIEKIENLENNIKLSQLILVGNQIEKIENLDHLTDLIHFEISGNQIKKIENLKKLTKIQTLSLGGNQIKKIEGLSTLTFIKELDLGLNIIEKIENLDHLTDLIKLDLRGNLISKLENLENLVNLKSMLLASNKIKKIENLKENSYLESLFLQSNEISSIENLEGFKNLETLFLNNNNITRIQDEENFLILLKNLITISISKNPFTETSWLDQETLSAIGFDVEQLIFRLEKHLANQITEVLDYPTKIILMGNSEVGKTTLSKQLIKDAQQFKGESGSTHGLMIRDWSDENAFIYDFGGQDYYHAVYQVFMTLYSQYIVIWDGDRNQNTLITSDREGKEFDKEEQYINYGINYWMGNIAYFFEKQKRTNWGKDKKLLIKLLAVQNKFDDQCPQGIYQNNTSDLQIEKQFHLSLNPSSKSEIDKLSLELLKAHIKQEITQLRPTVKLGTDEKRVGEYILEKFKKQKAYVKTNIQEIAEQNGLDNPDRIEFVLRILHQRGLILYFPDEEEIKNIIWINPAYISQQIYKVLNKATLQKEHGKIEAKKFEKAVNDKELLHLMSYKNIIFKNEEKDKTEYIIPQFLAESDKEDPLYVLASMDIDVGFYIKFQDFIPHGMMSRLICRFGKNPYKKHFYRYELLFNLKIRNQFAKVRIKLDMINLTVSVQVYCKNLEDSKDQLFEYLFRSILAAYWNDKHLDFDDYFNIRSTKTLKKAVSQTKVDGETQELIENFIDPSWSPHLLHRSVPTGTHLSINGLHFVDYRELLIDDSSHKYLVNASKLICEENNWKQMGQNLIDRALFNPFVTRKSDKTLSVFVSYSSKDRAIKEELVKYLAPLVNNHQIRLWTDREIIPGDNFDLTIKSELEKADIFIFLLSQDFFVSNYIQSVEVARAFERQEEGKAKVVPIIARPCTWSMDHRIKELDLLPKQVATNGNVQHGLGSISLWKAGQDDAMMNIYEGIKKVIDEKVWR